MSLNINGFEQNAIFRESRPNVGAMRRRQVKRGTATLPVYYKTRMLDVKTLLEVCNIATASAMEWGGDWPKDVLPWLRDKEEQIEKRMDSGVQKNEVLNGLRSAQYQLYLRAVAPNLPDGFKFLDVFPDENVVL
ncbi:MAG: hypothetical protein ACK5MA_03280 [Parachlamydiaceae bacterium]